MLTERKRPRTDRGSPDRGINLGAGQMTTRVARDQREQTEGGFSDFAKYDTVSDLATLISRRHSSGESVGLWWKSQGL
jgi:hypothetical protein